jgi:predicted transposase YdaD
MTVYTAFAPDPHDHLVRYVFCRPKAIAMLLRRALPKALLGVLDLRTLRYIPSVHINPRLRRREADLSFTVEAIDQGRRVAIFLVIEHQSRRDAHMPWRALVYKGETWDRYIRNQPRRSRRIPFMLSLLLTQHPARNTPTRLSSILDVSPWLRQLLGTPIELVMHADDFSGSVLGDRKAPAAIRALVELARAFLHAYENPGSLTPARLAELAPLVSVLLKHNRPDDVHALWVYAISVFAPGSPLHRMIMKSVDEPAQELYMTLKEALLARGEKRGQKLGRAQGQKLGHAQGQKLGRAQGKAEALLGLLEQREVPVSASVRKRVLATRDELALQRWLAQALTVTMAAELFEPERRRKAGTPASPAARRGPALRSAAGAKRSRAS